jgi:hypothetical protein
MTKDLSSKKKPVAGFSRKAAAEHTARSLVSGCAKGPLGRIYKQLDAVKSKATDAAKTARKPPR